MGASGYEKTIKRKVEQSELADILNQWQEEDNCTNGHQEGYSGDSQTVNEIVLHDRTFDDLEEATDYCLDNSERRDYFVAVYLEVDGEIHTVVVGWAAS